MSVASSERERVDYEKMKKSVRVAVRRRECALRVHEAYERVARALCARAFVGTRLDELEMAGGSGLFRDAPKYFALARKNIHIARGAGAITPSEADDMTRALDASARAHGRALAIVDAVTSVSRNFIRAALPHAVARVRELRALFVAELNAENAACARETIEKYSLLSIDIVGPNVRSRRLGPKVWRCCATCFAYRHDFRARSDSCARCELRERLGGDDDPTFVVRSALTRDYIDELHRGDYFDTFYGKYGEDVRALDESSAAWRVRVAGKRRRIDHADVSTRIGDRFCAAFWCYVDVERPPRGESPFDDTLDYERRDVDWKNVRDADVLKFAESLSAFANDLSDRVAEAAAHAETCTECTREHHDRMRALLRVARSYENARVVTTLDTFRCETCGVARTRDNWTTYTNRGVQYEGHQCVDCRRASNVQRMSIARGESQRSV